MGNEEECFYAALGVSSSADSAAIKRAYRELCLRFHPDTGGEGACVRRFQRIQTAYEVLSDSKARKNYDDSRHERVVEQEAERRRKRVAAIDLVTKLEIALGFSTFRRSFNYDFALSVLRQLSEGRLVSEKQKKAIDNILINFSIDLDRWLDDDFRQERLAIFYRNLEMAENERDQEIIDNVFEPEPPEWFRRRWKSD